VSDVDALRIPWDTLRRGGRPERVEAYLAWRDAAVRDRAVREALAPVRALADGYHEDAQTEVNANPASLARRAVYLRVSGDLRAALPDDREGDA
jgi:hypothetical protein